ncbi:hypothetical protein [Actinoallomurus iriomotensis]|uniref:hypothetical protein n=1 Tax=Actinoallomurus iriomotensis TaxID=478107 RepID=UPI002553D2D1|nr:hypothetical protein [Actinoallomurus iriomotensis]
MRDVPTYLPAIVGRREQRIRVSAVNVVPLPVNRDNPAALSGEPIRSQHFLVPRFRSIRTARLEQEVIKSPMPYAHIVMPHCGNRRVELRAVELRPPTRGRVLRLFEIVPVILPGREKATSVRSRIGFQLSDARKTLPVFVWVLKPDFLSA